MGSSGPTLLNQNFWGATARSLGQTALTVTTAGRSSALFPVPFEIFTVNLISEEVVLENKE